SIVVTQTGDYNVTVKNNEGCSGYDTITIRYWNEATSVKDVKAAEKISIFPNPAGSVINVVSEEKKMKSISVIDASGKIIWEQQVNTKTIQLSSEYWAAGIYNIEIRLSDKTLNFRQAIVK